MNNMKNIQLQIAKIIDNIENQTLVNFIKNNIKIIFINKNSIIFLTILTFFIYSWIYYFTQDYKTLLYSSIVLLIISIIFTKYFLSSYSILAGIKNIIFISLSLMIWIFFSNFSLIKNYLKTNILENKPEKIIVVEKEDFWTSSTIKTKESLVLKDTILTNEKIWKENFSLLNKSLSSEKEAINEFTNLLENLITKKDENGNFLLSWKYYSYSWVININNNDYLADYEWDADMLFYNPLIWSGIIWISVINNDNYKLLKENIINNWVKNPLNNLFSSATNSKDGITMSGTQVGFDYYYSHFILDNTIPKNKIILNISVDDSAIIFVNKHLIWYSKIQKDYFNPESEKKYKYSQEFFINNDYFWKNWILKNGKNEIIIMKADNKAEKTSIYIGVKEQM